MVWPVRVTEIARGGNAELVAYPFVRSDVVIVIVLVERRISGQSAHALNSSLLVQNAPDREIYVEFVESSYLRGRSSPLSKILRETPHPCVAQKTAKLSCCGQYFMSGPPYQRFDLTVEVCLSLVS